MNVTLHLSGTVERVDVPPTVTVTFACTECSVEFTSTGNWNKHCKTFKHLQKMKKPQEPELSKGKRPSPFYPSDTRIEEPSRKVAPETETEPFEPRLPHPSPAFDQARVLSEAPIGSAVSIVSPVGGFKIDACVQVPAGSSKGKKRRCRGCGILRGIKNFDRHLERVSKCKEKYYEDGKRLVILRRNDRKWKTKEAYRTKHVLMLKSAVIAMENTLTELEQSYASLQISYEILTRASNAMNNELQRVKEVPARDQSRVLPQATVASQSEETKVPTKTDPPQTITIKESVLHEKIEDAIKTRRKKSFIEALSAYYSKWMQTPQPKEPDILVFAQLYADIAEEEVKDVCPDTDIRFCDDDICECIPASCVKVMIKQHQSHLSYVMDALSKANLDDETYKLALNATTFSHIKKTIETNMQNLETELKELDKMVGDIKSSIYTPPIIQDIMFKTNQMRGLSNELTILESTLEVLLEDSMHAPLIRRGKIVQDLERLRNSLGAISYTESRINENAGKKWYMRRAFNPQETIEIECSNLREKEILKKMVEEVERKREKWTEGDPMVPFTTPKPFSVEGPFEVNKVSKK